MVFWNASIACKQAYGSVETALDGGLFSRPVVGMTQGSMAFTFGLADQQCSHLSAGEQSEGVLTARDYMYRCRLDLSGFVPTKRAVGSMESRWSGPVRRERERERERRRRIMAGHTTSWWPNSVSNQGVFGFAIAVLALKIIPQRARRHASLMQGNGLLRLRSLLAEA
jgi:hypothetical protein